MTSSHNPSVTCSGLASQVGKVRGFKEESHAAVRESWGLSLGDHSVTHPAISLLSNPAELRIKAGVETGHQKEHLAVEELLFLLHNLLWSCWPLSCGLICSSPSLMWANSMSLLRTGPCLLSHTP